MQPDDPVLSVIDAPNDLLIPYMLVGSYSSNLYGIERGTRDADFVIELGKKSVSALADRIKGDFTLDPQLGFETVTLQTRWRFKHNRSRFKLEMFLLVRDPFDQVRFGRRVRTELCDRVMWFQTREDVIVNKVRWGREKDLIDVKDVMKVQGKHLDWKYIETWTNHFGNLELLNRLRKAVE